MNDGFSKDEVLRLLEESSRYSEFGKISASVLHEISSPVTAALLSLEHADKKSIKSAKASLLQLNQYIHAARNQLRGHSSRRDFILDEEVKEIKRIVVPLAEAIRTKVLFSRVPAAVICGDPVKFQQLMTNLIVNAIGAYPEDGTAASPRSVSVGFRIITGNLQIVVKDKGKGINPRSITRIFDPFYSGNSKTIGGLGLGMLIVKQTLEEVFRGKINIDSQMNKGTTVSLQIPIRAAAKI